MIEKAERGELSSSELKELIEVVKLSQQVRTIHDNPPEGVQAGVSGPEAGPAKPAAAVPDETKELLKDIGELIKLLKAEREAKKAPERKANLQ